MDSWADSSLETISLESDLWKSSLVMTKNQILKSLYAVRHFFPLFLHKGHVDIVLANDAFLRDLNAQHRAQNKTTNVLSFPQECLKKGTYLPPYEFVLLGDIVLSHETIKREAACEGKDFLHHLSHLVVHGFLHLLGFDHETDEEAEKMERLEIQILEGMDIQNPYEEKGTT